MGFENDPEPVVGGIYMGMLIKKVTVKETTKVGSDGYTSLKKSFKMVLEGGIIMTEDRVVQSLESNDDEEMKKQQERQRRAEERRQREKERKDAVMKRRQEEREKAEREKEERRRRKELEQREKEEAAAKAEKERKRREEEEKAAAVSAAVNKTPVKKSPRKKVSFGPTTVSVIPDTPGRRGMLISPGANSTGSAGSAVWKFTDNDSIPDDFDLWKAQDVILFPGDCGSTNTDNSSYCLDDNKSTSDDSISLSGVWGFAPSGSSIGGSDAVSERDDLNEAFADLDVEEFPAPTEMDVWIYPPGTQPPDHFPNHGTYTFAKNSTWPPPIDESMMGQRVTGRVVVPDAFLQKARPQTITAYSRWKKPSETTTTTLPKSGREYTTPVGEWTYPPGDEKLDTSLEHADKWEPQDVLLYPPDQEPPACHQALPQGTWVTKQELIADPDDSEGSVNHWAPPDVYLYTPGVDPSDDDSLDQDDIVATGTWSYSVGPLKDTWPPPTEEEARRLRRAGTLPQWNPGSKGKNWKPQLANVFPRAKAPDSSTYTKPKGVWKYRHGNEPKGHNDWDTQQVMMYPSGQEPEGSGNGKPHGVWGLSKDSEPDDEGNWKPKDIWFFGPNEKPEDDCAIQGKWAIPVGMIDSDWPPKSKVYVSPKRKVGKLRIPGTFDNNNPPPTALSPTRSPRKLSPKKLAASSAHSVSSVSTSRSRDKPPVSPVRQSSNRKDDDWRKHMGEDITFPFKDDKEDEDPLTAPPRKPVRLDTYDSYDDDDDEDNGNNRGPKPAMAEYQSAFDYRPSASTTKKKKKSTSLKSRKKS